MATLWLANQQLKAKRGGEAKEGGKINRHANVFELTKRNWNI